MNYDATIRHHHVPPCWATGFDVPEIPGAEETVCQWLLTAPDAHPLWSQYYLSVVRLRDDVPGFPPPKRKFDGTTHELLVLAVDPTHGPYTVEDLAALQQASRPVPYLVPVNIAEQYIATDDEMVKLAWFAAWGVTVGLLNPETSDAPDRVRNQWLSVTTKTLAHIRGEEHAP